MPGTRLDPVSLILGASIAVKIVMGVLVFFSVASWFVIGLKLLHISRARRETQAFLRAYDNATSLESIATELGNFAGSPLARIFAAGYSAMRKITGGAKAKLTEAESAHVEGVARRAASEEVNQLESWMTLLGTIGSTAPFIGLFGTVYGIMDAFISIGNQGNANLPVVAPKIAEALIATAIGLVAAIPAVMAYNYFARKVGMVADLLEGFAQDVAARAKMGGL